MIFRVLDIETLVDESVWTKGEPTYKLGPNFQFDIIEPFPPAQACRVVAISYVDVGFDPAHNPRFWYERCYTECLWGRTLEESEAAEHELLAKFRAAMEGEDVVHLVTWNGRTFDLPVISMRSLKHKIPCKWYYESRDVRYRYSSEGHCDLMDFLADYGASRQMKLMDACHLIGLPGKTDMSGASIQGLYVQVLQDPTAGPAVKARVARYCLQDSLQTALLFLRSRFHLGKITVDTHNQVLETFQASADVRAAIDLDWELLKVG